MYTYPSPHFQSFIASNTNIYEQNSFFLRDFIQKQLALSQFRENQFRIQLQNLYLLQTSYMPQPLAPLQLIPQKYIQIESPPESYQTYPNSTPDPSTNEKDKYKTSIRVQVTNMLHFFLNEFGRSTKEDIIQERFKFNHDKEMLQLFDSLVEKYSSTIKSKEDMVRFVLRKAITHLRDRLRRKLNLSVKAASVAFCKKYFKQRVQKIVQVKKKAEGFIDNEEILNFLLPYKKNSRNKTPNSCFTKEIFSSEIFCQDYHEYVEKFEKILEKDNEKKITRFIDFLVRCVKESTTSRVSGYKRLPWLKSWLEDAKTIAEELLLANQSDKKSEKLKDVATKKQIILTNEES